MTSGSSSGSAKCCNPDCTSDDRGKLKCSACLTVFYCSPECGKKHWPVHKQSCSKATKASKTESVPPSSSTKGNSSVAGVNTGVINHPELIKSLEDMKKLLQTLFQKRDFATAAVVGEKALLVTKELIELKSPMGLTESIQIQLNLTTAYIETRKLTEANTTSANCVALCEICIKNKPNHPPYIEMATLALTSRALVLMNSQEIDEAFTIITRCMSMCDMIFNNKDPRLCKSLRIYALILEKQGKTAEAEKQMFRGYLILTVSVGIHTRDCQVFFDELLEMVTRRKDFKQAEVYAVKNYESLKTWDAGKDGLEFADCSARLGSLYAMQGKFVLAKPLLEKTVQIRSAKLGPNHLGTAHAVLQMCTLYEKMGHMGVEVETMLGRVIEIFATTYGQDSMEVQNTLAQLRRVRAKRTSNGGSMVAKTDGGSDDEIDCKVVDESKPSTGKKAVDSLTDSLAGLDLTTLKPKDGDANARLMLASKLFEQAHYSHAEVMLHEAYEILQAEEPGGQRSQIALQNLQVARQKGMNKLWMQVVTEELLSDSAGDSGGASPPSGDVASTPSSQGAGGKKARNGKKTSGQEDPQEDSSSGDSKYTVEEQESINEYKKMMAAASASAPPKSGCHVC